MKFNLNILKIRKNEVSKVLYFFFFAIFLQSGIAIGESVANSLFLVNLGYEKLPIIYILTPIIILLVYLPIYFGFVKRYGEDSFFKISLIFLIFINILIFLGINFLENRVSKDIFNLLYYFVLLYTTIWSIALYTLFWNFLDSFFDILESKRLFPILSAGTAIGAITGGSFVSILTKYTNAINLLIVWSIFAFLTYISLLLIKKKFKKNIALEEDEDSGEDISILTQFVLMIKNMKSSRYVLVLFFLFFLSIILSTLLEFEYMNILSKGESEESLASLFGTLFAVVNVFNLIVNFFLFNRLVLNYGVRNVLLIQPIVYLLSFIYLSLSLDIGAGLFGFFVVQGVLVSIDYNNQNFLYNGIKSNIKYQVRTFIENLGEPMGTAVAGIFLFFISNKITPFEIAFIGVIFGFIYLILAIILRYYYPKAMVDNLKSDWLNFSKDEKVLISKLDKEELTELDKYLVVDDSKKELALSILYLNNIEKTTKLLLPYINKTKNLPKELLTNILNSTNSQVPKIIIDWIDKNRNNIDILLIRELGIYGFIPLESVVYMLNSNNPMLQSSASVVMLNSPYPDEILKANMVVSNLLKKTDMEFIKEGIYALGESKHKEYAIFLTRFLKNSDFSIRKEALLAIYKLSDNSSSKIVTPILDIFEKGNWIERDLALDILSKIKDSQYIIPLFQRSSILRPSEKRKINSLINGLGLQTIPSIVTVLVEDRFSYNVRSIAGRILGNLSFAQFKALEEELILSEIKKAYEFLNFYTIIQQDIKKRSDNNLELLSFFYRDIQSIILEFILELLTIGGRLPDFEMIKTAINSTNSNSRANAIETIEQSTDREIFTLLRPLIDGRDIDDIMDFYKSKFPIKEIDIEYILDTALNSNNSLEIEIVLEVLYFRQDDYLNKFREKLKDKIDIKNSIFYLLENKAQYTIVEKLIFLTQHKLSKRFNIFELYMMSKNSTILELKKGDYLYKKREDINYIYLLLDGEVTDAKLKYVKGDVVGFNSILDRRYIKDIKDIVCSKNTKFLVLSINSIIDAIYTYPKIGIEFLLIKSSQNEKISII